MKILKIEKHKKVVNGTIEHTAEVEISGAFEKNRDLVEAVNKKLKYRPGVFHLGVEKIGNNKYYIEWESER